MPEKCHAIGCNTPAITRGLCDKHRKRLERHGHVAQTRAKDWGDRNKHPAYKTWCGLRRNYRQSLPEAWVEDFWTFAGDVPERPDGKCSAHRSDPTAPFSRENFYWKVPRLYATKLGSRAEYMRDWQRAARAGDPDYGKAAFLKRRYGVTLAWYEGKLVEQNGVCAICEKPESTVLKGKQIALAIDHNHDTGAVRGLLCSNCNTALGLFEDSPSTLAKAAAYLVSFSLKHPSEA